MSWLDDAIRAYQRVAGQHGDRDLQVAEQAKPAPRLQARDPHDLPQYDEEQATQISQNYLKRLWDPRLRATQLLFRVLPRQEVVRFVLHGVVLVRADDGGFYEISLGRSSNVVYHDADCRARIIYCAAPKCASDMQLEDVVAAQYLALRYNRDAFMKVANRQLVH